MKRRSKPFILAAFVMLQFCNSPEKDPGQQNDQHFPKELTVFKPWEGNPVFAATDSSTWDRHIRERGFILKEQDGYHMWYTGYAADDKDRHLGYATSADGIRWNRYEQNPLDSIHWIEDMFVVKKDSMYYMFAEGRDDVAHLFTSPDKIRWARIGDIQILKTDGNPIDKGPYGTPTAWFENDIWYLFYERGDLGIWLATSKDMKRWQNVQDEPVIALGPAAYDQYAVAMNQVIKYNGLYYGYYHASAWEDWREWSTNIAVSKDLIHWEKFSGNPIISDNTSSGIVVPEGKGYHLYTMHPEVKLFLPAMTATN